MHRLSGLPRGRVAIIPAVALIGVENSRSMGQWSIARGDLLQKGVHSLRRRQALVGVFVLLVGLGFLWGGVRFTRNWQREGVKAHETVKRAPRFLYDGRPSLRYYQWHVRIMGAIGLVIGAPMTLLGLYILVRDVS